MLFMNMEVEMLDCGQSGVSWHDLLLYNRKTNESDYLPHFRITSYNLTDNSGWDFFFFFIHIYVVIYLL